MKALVFHRPGRVEVNDVPDPRIESEDDVILRVTATAICGSDLHIYNGFIPQKNDIPMRHTVMKFFLRKKMPVLKSCSNRNGSSIGVSLDHVVTQNRQVVGNYPRRVRIHRP